ncbi:uncharacterized protein N0V89_004387 [Didymosphaeria variabile]|uniref:Uncharacterized protein n=1 Tax=Didymosphaeria variabile TaxID=1932322 RepID=A0A9W8XPC3_9PLEO|nr:uncharacterized protein N0V89_004387 [Didymosphaeria variabile]KAJ4356355.1 hypothetical protein N0V89_004387 [Didymosphaeria variabile]
MSKNLMTTEPGGESQQYEGSMGYIEPHSKQAGQLGDPSTTDQPRDPVNKSASSGPNTQGVTPAEKMRYGQTIQESGGGAGKTDVQGQANSEGGFGETKRLGEEGDAVQQRRAQGYGGDMDMDRNIGA